MPTEREGCGAEKPRAIESSYAEGLYQGSGLCLFFWGIDTSNAKTAGVGVLVFLLSFFVIWRRGRDSNP